ncbi:DUF5362 family protein [Pedobacter nanyangensis]|uniref:DUF5362 family protein n=1 Tax=Pedobacter nanyangensis TaxID=1562389 RepID=UPI000DE4E4F9|nr:DUF5362 family protein [Pedobacter nanyangensis]
MENNFEQTAAQEQPNLPQLIVTENMRSYLYDMAGWTKFLGIVGFIFSGLMILVAFSMGAIFSTISQMPGMDMYSSLGSGVLTFIMLFYALLFLYPSLMLFSYAVKAKQGVLYADQLSLETSIGKLKSFFKFYGIMMIIAIAFYVLIFFLALVGGMAAA